MYPIGIVNQSSVKLDLDSIVRALQLQVTAHFYPYWGLNAKLAVFPKPEKNWWNIYIADDADQAGALGYHDETDDGKPQGFVFAKTSIADGEEISSVLSHELLEMIADPMASMGVQVGDNEWWAYESCDAVQGNSYKIAGVTVSDFVLPSWFNPAAAQASHGGSYDYLGLTKKPLQILKDGYMPVFKDGKWTQIFGSVEAGKKFNAKKKTRSPFRASKFVGKSKPEGIYAEDLLKASVATEAKSVEIKVADSVKIN